MGRGGGSRVGGDDSEAPLKPPAPTASGFSGLKVLVLVALLAGALTFGVTNGVARKGMSGRPVAQPRTVHGIVYFVVSSLRADFGGAETPNIDGLRERGMTFARTYAQQASSAPSRLSFFTAKRPDTLKVWGVRQADEERSRTLPSALRSAGWLTAGVGQVFDAGRPDDAVGSWSRGFSPPHADSDEDVVEEAKSVLNRLQVARLNGMRPFFLAVGLSGGKPPLNPSPAFLKAQDSETSITVPAPTDPVANISLFRCPEAARPTPKRRGKRAQKQDSPVLDMQRKIRLYRAAVSQMDHYVGVILKHLKETGASKSTAVVLHSDHGWALGERGQWCAHTNFEVALRVPLVISVPWLQQSHGVRTTALVELVDVMPTVLDLAAAPLSITVELESEMEGTSLLPLLLEPERKAASWKAVAFSQHPRCSRDLSVPSRNNCSVVSPSSFTAMGYSARSARWRLTVYVEWDGQRLQPKTDSTISEELFHHAGDQHRKMLTPGENTNLADPQHSRTVAMHRGWLSQGWVGAMPGRDRRYRVRDE